MGLDGCKSQWVMVKSNNILLVCLSTGIDEINLIQNQFSPGVKTSYVCYNRFNENKIKPRMCNRSACLSQFRCLANSHDIHVSVSVIRSSLTYCKTVLRYYCKVIRKF